MFDILFYQKHLNSVSRSFAFCIERLDSPLRDWVSLMYLLCRIIDTAEDVPWKNTKARSHFFSNFREAIKSVNGKELFIKDSEFLNNLNSQEHLLISDSSKIFKDFHTLDPDLKNIIQDLTLSMSQGMEYFLEQMEKEKTFRIKNSTELNQYCFFVAGIVGEALTRLLGHLDNKEPTREQLFQSYHFGLFLQKINILKDQLKDESQGRYFVYDRKEIREQLIDHADQSFKYIQHITWEHKDYKIFCSWSFFVALASLPYIDKSYQNQKVSKIPRIKTINLIHKVEKMITSNDDLGSVYEKYRRDYLLVNNKITTIAIDSALGVSKQNPLSVKASTWLNQYQGVLNENDIQGRLRC